MNWTLLEEDIQTNLGNLAPYLPAKLKVGQKELCVVKTDDGVYGISNKCPHAGAQLHHGHCNKKGIIGCPLHGYKFDVRTGKSADGNNYKIPHYRFEIREDKWYIGAPY